MRNHWFMLSGIYHHLFHFHNHYDLGNARVLLLKNSLGLSPGLFRVQE